MTTGHSFAHDWFTHSTRQFEEHLAHLRGQPCNIIEIGAHEGRCTTWLLDNILTNELSRIICIDVFTQPNFWQNVAASGGIQKTQMFKGLSGQILRSQPLGVADFVYIDGSHLAPDVLEDAVLSFPLLKRGGIMAFDDYLWNDPKYLHEDPPKLAVDAFLDMYKFRIELLEKGHQVWIRKINDRPAPPNQPVGTS